MMKNYPFFSLVEIDRMPFEEIELRTKSIALADLEQQNQYVQNAFIDRIVQTQEEKGGKIYYKFKEPKELFDLEKQTLALFGEVKEEDKNKIDDFLEREKIFNNIFGKEE